MTGERKKRCGGRKLFSFITGTVLLAGLCFPLLTPRLCSGMDTLTHSEMEKLSGQTGISVTWCGTATTKQTFTSLTPIPGDPDGWGNSQDDDPGYLVFIGTGSNTGYIGITTPEGTVFTCDVGTSGATGCQPAGGAPYAGIQVPADTTFFTFTLSTFTLNLVNPETVNIMAATSPSGAPGTMDQVGWIKPTGLAIDKVDQTSTCYIWRH